MVKPMTEIELNEKIENLLTDTLLHSGKYIKYPKNSNC